MFAPPESECRIESTRASRSHRKDEVLTLERRARSIAAALRHIYSLHASFPNLALVEYLGVKLLPYYAI
jgi:hypothetical protein